MQTLSQGISRIKNLLHVAEVTRATVYGIMGAGWGFVTGPVTAVFIISYFTPEEQGYYYTFSSVLALNILFELGFSDIVKYFAAHEWAKLSLDPRGRIAGDADALSRLVSLGQASFRWYLLGGVIVAFGIGTAGYIFFSRSPTADAGVTWVAPWFALSILSGVNMMLTPTWSVLEGCNQVSQVYSFRMVGSVLRTLLIWVAVVCGGRLWTASAGVAAILVWSIVFLFWRYRNFLESFFSKPTGPRVSWWGEIWQVQWRTAMSYINTFFISYIFTPVLFHFHGPVVAGQFGMSWVLAVAVGSVATMWSTPRGPQFATMIARKEYKALDQLLYRIIAVALGVMLLGGLAVWLLVYGLNMLNHPFAARLLPPLPIALISLGVAAANVLSPTSVYLRAHKKEPYVLFSIVAGILIGLSSLILGKQFSAIGVAVAYLGSNLILLPWGLAIFYHCRREWHAVS